VSITKNKRKVRKILQEEMGMSRTESKLFCNFCTLEHREYILSMTSLERMINLKEYTNSIVRFIPLSWKW